MGPRFGLGAFQLFLMTMLGLQLLAQVFWFRAGWRAAGRIHSPTWTRGLRTLLVLAAAWIAVEPADSIFWHVLPHRGLALWMVTVARLWLLPSSMAFLLVKIVHGAEWLWGKLVAAQSRKARIVGSAVQAPTDLTRRSFFRYSAALAGAVPLAASVYGYAKDRLQYTVRYVDAPIMHLPPALEGFRMVQLSDIHIGDFMPPEEIRRAVDMANALRAHTAFVTGDFVTHGPELLEACVAELSRLQAPLGVWGCNGNHELYTQVEARAQKLFQQYGMRLLRQEQASLLWRGAEINLIGVDYQRERPREGWYQPMLTGIEALVRRDVPNILLSHNPNSFPRAAELGIDLSLAGHTHGGQVQVEIVDHRWSPARFITSFVAGLYARPRGDRKSRALLYVNRGLGTIGIPVRLGVRPEITLLTLRSDAPG